MADSSAAVVLAGEAHERLLNLRKYSPMQTLPISVPDPAYQQWERLSESDKQALEKRLNRALGTFLFQKNSSLIRQELQGRGPYQSDDELLEGVS